MPIDALSVLCAQLARRARCVGDSQVLVGID